MEGRLVEVARRCHVRARECRGRLRWFLHADLEKVVLLVCAGIHERHRGVGEDDGEEILRGGDGVVGRSFDGGDDPIESGCGLGRR